MVIYMTVTEAIQTRRSIRKFVPDAQIPQEHIEQILTAAMMAPSACNTRPWSFIVIRDRSKMDEIRKVHPYTSMLETASLAIVVVAQPEAQKGICDGYFPEDCGAATQNILLQAWELGYGSCWCGVYPKEERIAELTDLLALDGIPFNVIALGVPAEAPAARGFFDPAKVTYV